LAQFASAQRCQAGPLLGAQLGEKKYVMDNWHVKKTSLPYEAIQALAREAC